MIEIRIIEKRRKMKEERLEFGGENTTFSVIAIPYGSREKQSQLRNTGLPLPANQDHNGGVDTSLLTCTSLLRDQIKQRFQF